MNVSWSEVRLAHTRWWLGLGRFGRSVGCRSENRLSITWAGVRTIGGWLWTAATVAIRFWLAFSPLPAHDPQCSLGLDHRDALAVDRAIADDLLG